MFNVRAKIVGPQGQYVKHVQNETRTRVQLKGYGSGYLEADTGRESDEPLYINILYVQRCCLTVSTMQYAFLPRPLILKAFLLTPGIDFHSFECRGNTQEDVDAAERLCKDLVMSTIITSSTRPSRHHLLASLHLLLIHLCLQDHPLHLLQSSKLQQHPQVRQERRPQ